MDRVFTFPFISYAGALNWSPCYGAQEINTFLLLLLLNVQKNNIIMEKFDFILRFLQNN